MLRNLPKRVLMTADTLGGVWVYTIELAKALSEKGTEVAVAAMGGPLSPERRDEAGRVPGLSVYESNYRLEWMDDPWEDVDRAGEWLLHLEALLRPDIIHLNGYAHGALPWQTPVLMVGHSCVLSWWNAVKGNHVPAGWDTYRHRVREGLSSADFVAAPSEAMLNCLRAHYGPIPRSRAVYNGRSPGPFSPKTKYPLIFSAGRLWDEAKNISVLERVAPGVPWPIFVAGERSHPDGKFVNFRNLRAFGPLSEDSLAGWLGRSSIYALPARYEPFGLSILEAALSGCALVLGDIESLREIWDGAAFFVPPEDAGALKSAFSNLISDSALRTRLAAFARKRALGLTASRMADEYLSIYSELLDSETNADKAFTGDYREDNLALSRSVPDLFSGRAR